MSAGRTFLTILFPELEPDLGAVILLAVPGGLIVAVAKLAAAFPSLFWVCFILGTIVWYLGLLMYIRLLTNLIYNSHRFWIRVEACDLAAIAVSLGFSVMMSPIILPEVTAHLEQDSYRAHQASEILGPWFFFVGLGLVVLSFAALWVWTVYRQKQNLREIRPDPYEE